MTTKKPSQIVTKAMLVDLTISRFMGTRTDQIVTDHVKTEYHANGNVGRYAKKLFPQDPPELKRVNAIANEAAAIHRQATLPWMTGWRILPREYHGEYATKIAKCRLDMEDAVAELARALPRLRSEAEQMLGKMFSEADYPSAAKIIASHGIDVKFMPVPDVGDFRVELDADSLEEIQRGYESNMQASIQSAVQNIWTRLHDALEALTTALGRDERTLASGDKVVFVHPNVIDNIRKLVESIPTLNIVDDPNIEAIRRQVETQIAKFSAGDLRTDDTMRNEAKKKADAILKKMSAFIGD